MVAIEKRIEQNLFITSYRKYSNSYQKANVFYFTYRYLQYDNYYLLLVANIQAGH